MQAISSINILGKMDKVAIFCIYLTLVSMHQVEVKGKINF